MNQIYNLFFDLIKKFPYPFIALVFLVFLQVILNSLSIISIAPIVEFLTSENKNNINEGSFFLNIYSLLFKNTEVNLFFLISIFGILMLFVAISSTLIRYMILKIQYLVLILLQTDNLRKFFSSNFSFFNQTNQGILLNSFSKEITKIGVSFSQFASIIANSFQILIIILIPISISPSLTFFFIIISFLMVTPVFLIRNYIFRLGKKNVDTSNFATQALQEALTSAKLVYSFNNQDKVVNNYSKLINEHANVSIILQTLTSSIYLILTPLGLIAALIVLNKGYNENIGLTDLAIIIFAFSRIVPILSQIFQSKATIEGISAAYDQIFNLNMIADQYIEKEKTISISKFSDGIFFNNVSFDYKLRKNIIKKLSIKFIKNETTLIIGRSGSGKTTIADLIMGLYKPDSGHIYFDNYKYSEIKLSSLRGFISYVPQEPQLFNYSVKENLLWANPNADNKKIWNVLELANANDFVDKLPEKLDTNIGDRGNKLSGGQKQRLALARALIKEPEILILDEATSFLDSESEALILKSISKLMYKMTIIIITHKITSDMSSDNVYVIDNGMISEHGKFKDLKKEESSYLNKLLKS